MPRTHAFSLLPFCALPRSVYARTPLPFLRYARACFCLCCCSETSQIVSLSILRPCACCLACCHLHTHCARHFAFSATLCCCLYLPFLPCCMARAGVCRAACLARAHAPSEDNSIVMVFPSGRPLDSGSVTTRTACVTCGVALTDRHVQLFVLFRHVPTCWNSLLGDSVAVSPRSWGGAAWLWEEPRGGGGGT